MNQNKRYFIVTTYYKGSHGGSSGSHYAITDGSYPSKRVISNYYRIPSNDLNMISVSEVKSVKDITDFFEYSSDFVKDEINYPWKPSDDNY